MLRIVSSIVRLFRCLCSCFCVPDPSKTRKHTKKHILPLPSPAEATASPLVSPRWTSSKPRANSSVGLVRPSGCSRDKAWPSGESLWGSNDAKETVLSFDHLRDGRTGPLRIRAHQGTSTKHLVSRDSRVG